MPSKTSLSEPKAPSKWFSKAMFLQTWNSFAPIPIGYFIVMFMALPMNIFMWELNLELDTGIFKDLSVFPSYAVRFGLVSAFLLGILSAMLVYRHLGNSRSANMIHALPISRTSLYITQYLAGFTFVLVPNIILLLLTMIALIFQGLFYFEPIFYLFAVQTGLFFFFYSFGVFCAMLTGSVGAVAIYYLVLNFVVAFVTMLIEPLLTAYLIGYNGTIFQYPFVQLLTPTYALVLGAKVTPVYNYTNTPYELGGYYAPLPENISYVMPELSLFLGYLGVGVLFTLLGLWFYKVRHLESAGEAISMPWLKPVFRFLWAVVGGTSLGIISVVVVFEATEGALPRLIMPIASLFWGVAFAFIAEMILEKSFRVWKKWKNTLLPSMAVLGFFAIFIFDLTGFENSIPTQDEIQSVSLQASPLYPFDSGSQLDSFESTTEGLSPEHYQLIQKVHQTALPLARSSRNLIEALEDPDTHDYTSRSFYVQYKLGDGYSLERLYPIYSEETPSPEHEAYTSALLDLFQNREILRKAYQLDDLAYNISGLTFIGSYNPEGDDPHLLHPDSHVNPQLNQVDLENLYDQLGTALVADFDAGHLGKKYISTAIEEYLNQVYYSSIRVTWTQSVNTDNSANLSQKENTTSPKPLGESNEFSSHLTRIALNKDCTYTLQVLEDFGLLDQYHLLTNLEYLSLFPQWYEEGTEESLGKVPRLGQETKEDFMDPMTYLPMIS